ncbi:MAG: AAA family ATPase [Bryobacteraceae bacterium]
MPRVIEVPELSVIVLMGASGSGKSTFARQHFQPSEILSSDAFRAAVADDESDQSVTADAFEALYYMAEKRLKNARLCVIDATNVRAQDRSGYVQLAKRYHVATVGIVFRPNAGVSLARNLKRPHRQVAEQVVHTQIASLQQDLAGLEAEGFGAIHILDPTVDTAVEIVRKRFACNKRDQHGPFDIIGDVHGCYKEMAELLSQLGYQETATAADDPIWGSRTWSHPNGRKAVFVGDLVDRGPHALATMRAARNMVMNGSALTVPGNHDIKFSRWLRGNTVTTANGLNRSIADFQSLHLPLHEAAAAAFADFLDNPASHYVLDGGKLVVAHAGLGADLQGRCTNIVREMAIFGKLPGEEYDLHWAEKYHGRAMVVYGHIPITEPDWVNGTINIDTGCVFGRKLTALRYPEIELVSVVAQGAYDVYIPNLR